MWCTNRRDPPIDYGDDVRVSRPVRRRGLVQEAPLQLLAHARRPPVGQSEIVEAAPLAARFADPPVRYATPAFASGRQAFTSNAEIRQLIVKKATHAELQASVARGEVAHALVLAALYWAKV